MYVRLNVNFIDDIPDSLAADAASFFLPLKSLGTCGAGRMFARQKESIDLSVIADLAFCGTATSVVIRLGGSSSFMSITVRGIFSR